MRFVVVGAGVAGVCCLRELVSRLPPDARDVTLIAPGDNAKARQQEPTLPVSNLRPGPRLARAAQCVENVERVTRKVDVFNVVETPLALLLQPGVRLVRGNVAGVDEARQVLRVQPVGDGATQEVPYDALCFATGSQPKRLAGVDPAAAACVVTVRDTDSVAALATRLRVARRIMVVGNGGIAMELIHMLHRLRRHEVHWVVRHDGIGDAFFDRDAGAFLLSVLAASADVQPHHHTGASSDGGQCLAADAGVAQSGGQDAAVGPSWQEQLAHGCAGPAADEVNPADFRVHTHLRCEVARIRAGEGAEALVELTSGASVPVDVIVMAAGVVPCVDWAPPHWERAPDGALCVDDHMRVLGCQSAVFAAGDVAHVTGWAPRHWHQMRLWSQARQAGHRAGACMSGAADAMEQTDGAFDLFTHSTQFFGQRVVLLGRYNAQGLGGEEQRGAVVTYSRVQPPQPGGDGGSFVRVLLCDGRMRGAVLIGEEACGLCEAFEHLILDELDLSPYGPHILDPDVDIEDYFD